MQKSTIPDGELYNFPLLRPASPTPRRSAKSKEKVTYEWKLVQPPAFHEDAGVFVLAINQEGFAVHAGGDDSTHIPSRLKHKFKALDSLPPEVAGDIKTALEVTGVVEYHVLLAEGGHTDEIKRSVYLGKNGEAVHYGDRAIFIRVSDIPTKYRMLAASFNSLYVIKEKDSGTAVGLLSNRLQAEEIQGQLESNGREIIRVGPSHYWLLMNVYNLELYQEDTDTTERPKP